MTRREKAENKVSIRAILNRKGLSRVQRMPEPGENQGNGKDMRKINVGGGKKKKKNNKKKKKKKTTPGV